RWQLRSHHHVVDFSHPPAPAEIDAELLAQGHGSPTILPFSERPPAVLTEDPAESRPEPSPSKPAWAPSTRASWRCRRGPVSMPRLEISGVVFLARSHPVPSLFSRPSESRSSLESTRRAACGRPSSPANLVSSRRRAPGG